jgi:cobalt-precorrin 5A hydrolase
VERGVVTLQNEPKDPSEQPVNAVAGFGFRSDATVASLREALHACQVASSGFISLPISIIFLATAEDKVNHPALTELAQELGISLKAVALAQLVTLSETATAQPATLLNRIPKRYGARSLAESSALVAAGPGAELLAPRSLSIDKMATAAIAVIAVSTAPIAITSPLYNAHTNPL